MVAIGSLRVGRLGDIGAAGLYVSPFSDIIESTDVRPNMNNGAFRLRFHASSTPRGLRERKKLLKQLT
jgi:hypothetical protein